MIEPLLQAERLLTLGLLDQAEQLYARTLESDPRNAIAAVGLARVAVERDDLRLGHQRTCAALEIDRQNPTALRLERRLAEILAERGEGVDRPDWLGGRTEAASRPKPDAGEPAEPEPQAGQEPDPAAQSTAEQAVLARNPSMGDHRRMESERAQPERPIRPAAETQPTGSGRPRQRRRGLLRRLLGR